MLEWVIIFFVVAVIAGFLGFRDVSSAATDIARTLFYIFIILFILSLLGNFVGVKTWF